MTNLFDPRAVQSRHRVGTSNGPITLLSPPLKATMALGVVIALGAGLWATFARIPLTVQGVGILLPVGAITSSISQIDGVAIWMVSQPREPWQEKAWNFYQNPGSFNDQSMAKLARSILLASESAQIRSDSTAIGSAMPLLKYRGSRFARGHLMVWVQNSAQKGSLSGILDQLDRTLRLGKIQNLKILNQQRVLRSEYNSRSIYLASMKKLEVKGYVSRDAILAEQSTLDGVGSQILNNDAQLLDLERQRNQAYQSLRNQLASLIEQQLIFAPNDVYLEQANTLNGETVITGQELLKLSDQPLNETTLVPVFIGNNEVAQVRPGMTALATPAGYKRSEFGGIRGKVVFKAKLPGTLETVTARVGVASLAQQIVAQEPSPTLLMLALEKVQGKAPPNSGGYRWSSSSSLPFAPVQGERLDVEITTIRVHPIELVLPSLKRWFGLVPPDVAAPVRIMNQ